MLHDPSKDRALSQYDRAINAAVDLLERTWVGHTPEMAGQSCLVTALYSTTSFVGRAMLPVREAMDDEAQSRGFDRTELWNDAPGRTKQEAIAFMEAVRLRLG